MKIKKEMIFATLACLLIALSACKLLPANVNQQNNNNIAEIEILPSETPLIVNTLTPTQLPPQTPLPIPTLQSLSDNHNQASIGDPYAPDLGNLGYDVQTYDIQIKLDPALPYQVEASVTLNAILTADMLESISLDFIGFNIHNVYLNGTLAEFQRDWGKLYILLPEDAGVGTALQIQVDYSGEPLRKQSIYAPFEAHIGLFYPEDGDSMYILSEPDGARYWMPANDHPRDKALFHFEITVPAGYTAIANGLLLDTSDNANTTQTFTWEHAYPMSPYLATIAVGEYERIESVTISGVLIRDYVFPEDIQRWQAEFDVTDEAIVWLEDMLGPYPFEAYGHVDVLAEGVSLETQSMVLISTYMIREETMVHELTHMWFGDLVSLDSWGEMWRNEGFATYFHQLWPYRNDYATFVIHMDNLQTSIESDNTLEPLNDLTPSNLFSYESYIKGAVVVHALRKEVGDDAFFAGLQLYLQRYAYSTASDADFIAAMEEASGMDLTDFFEYWLE